jgi:putative transcriptional regulator
LGRTVLLLLGLGLSPPGDAHSLDMVSPPRAYTSTPVAKPAKGVFLVATQTMPDPRFRRTVILLVAHDQTGTLGLIINRPTELRLAEVLPDAGKLAKHADPLFFGGPVAPERLLYLVGGQGSPEGLTAILADGVYVGADRTVLERWLAADKPPEHLRLYFGHAGWAPRQLDAEIAGGGWRLFRADPVLLFHESPETIWELFLTQPGLMTFRQTTGEQSRTPAVAVGSRSAVFPVVGPSSGA